MPDSIYDSANSGPTMAGGYSNDMAGGARPLPITGQGVAGINCIYCHVHFVHFVHFKCVSAQILSSLDCASHPSLPMLRRYLQHPTGYAAAAATAAASVRIRSSSNGRIWQRLQRGSW